MLPLSCLSGLLFASSPARAETEAVLDPEVAFVAGETTLWSPLFQASWDKLNSLHEGEPERVEPPNKLIKKLNTYQWDEETVFPADSYQVFAGPATEEFHDEAAKKIEAFTGLTIPPLESPSPNGNLIFGALSRDLEFKSQFFQSKKKALQFTDGSGKEHPCSFFGTAGKTSGAYGDTVKVLHYDESQKSFTLSIASEKEGETLIIFRDPKVSSFEQAIQQVRGHRQTEKASRLREGDIVKIPYLNLKSETSFTSRLQGKRFYKGEAIPWIIADAYQLTEFELFEKGARIKVATGASDEPFGLLPAPRNFACDGPFLVFGWREGVDIPYLAVRVDSGEVLTPFEKE